LNNGLKVAVRPGSPAARAGVPTGALLLKINGQPITDVIDYMFHAAGPLARVTLKIGQRVRVYRIAKEYDEDLGLILPPLVPRTCHNKCQFCFMAQLPPQVRPTLRVRDEDYRLSFLFGNYITMTNLREKDWQRLEQLRLSPLYVSVHATDEIVRRQLLGRLSLSPLLPQLQRLAASRITVHAQLVLCPGINDGEVLEQSLRDLEKLYPWVSSVALVPVGLTKYRKGLAEIRPYTRKQARQLVDKAVIKNKTYRTRWGEGWLYLADEFFFLSGESLPGTGYYDDYPQIENGVGMARRLLRCLARRRPSGVRPYYVLTGELAAGIIKPWASRHRIKVCPVKNRFLGSTINVAGLLAGRDIARELKKIKRGTVYLPAAALNDDGKFIDDLSLAELCSATQATIKLVDNEGRQVKG